ncbi:MAG: tRNA preQ1(34) S-adenosylmethionine ribosyltransferase-isomerase QueA [Gammaproteobacteria bacterium]|nr:tRNA preQ1(34) S-adenosylmethionine ribosyltransferase-isomerase QueA [Gammaproteobacteria bacterium]
MWRRDFAYELPDGLIAQYPAPRRDAARLLCLDRRTGDIMDRRFTEFPHLLQAGDLVVLNDTRVLPARLLGRKATGGRVEVLVERIIDVGRMLAQVRASKSPRAGSTISVDGGGELHVEGREGEFFILAVKNDGRAADLVEAVGHVPLPPYIRRADEAPDRDRYQTVYARHPGAVAAPTAGLHFTDEMIKGFTANGIATRYLTLHVGAGTFQPVRAERIEEHVMHKERFEVPEALCAEIRAVRERKGRVVAVGTTCVRALESAARTGGLKPANGETDIFIYPGFEFRIVDALLTNFHLPESTLLMLVCAFAGRERVLRAYEHAVREHYRFYSYGDAMFISFAA